MIIGPSLVAMSATSPATAASANRADYIGGTVTALTAGQAGTLELTDEHFLAYYAKSGQVRVAYDRVEFLAPVFAGDYVEAEGRIASVGRTARKMEFEARKIIAARPDIDDSAADVLNPPVVVCRASGTCVTPAAKKRIRNDLD